jgi:hypothetical protein
MSAAELLPQHAALLEASAIAAEVAEARGYRSVSLISEIRDLGFAKGCLTPGLLIPIHGVDGTIRTYQYRADTPRLSETGKPRKYEFPYKATQALDVPPAALEKLGDPTIPLWFTEGARKADSAVSAGLACISLSGVYGWRGKNPQGGTTALPDFESIALNGRDVLLAFDSDVTINPEVAKALSRFTSFLEYRRAKVSTIYLPANGSEKVGLDDFLAAHGVDELMALVAKSSKPKVAAVPPPPPLPPSTPRTLAEVETIFLRWVNDDDPVPTRAVLAAYVANRKLAGDPVWLMLVGGSGVGKTERLIPLAAMPDVVLESSITGPAALLSGTGNKDRAKDSTGGLLRKFPDASGILLLKDFTSILDMHRDARAEVLAALREIYDGRWDRSIGVDGGRTLSWTGRLGLVAGCTTAIDSAHAVMSSMGTRFMLLRLKGDSNIASSALEHVGAEQGMRDDLRAAVRGLLEHLPGKAYDKNEVRESLIALSNFVARARSPVDRDSQGEIRLVLDPEAPTRIVKMLALLWCASGMLGLERAQAWKMVRRIGLDSIPKLRGAILDYLAGQSFPATTTAVAEKVDHPTRTTRRGLEDLAAHQVVTRTPGGEGRADLWHLSPGARAWLGQTTLPVLSGEAHERPNNPDAALSERDLSLKGERSQGDKTGKVGSPEESEGPAVRL